ncbi:hypothetical protein [Paenibacillus harenae]|uniref:ABC transporter permease n=1 Tax=Paenibacillus harenae TaxID=306543 RepID=A0ABT9U4Y4_PAEHA|nr:hypothetical protein [Paenibacillus harenae]MDQ0062298.1 hypothetical protein [Paenibacillus harenae]MDQ0114695.1 hypothetical protein [Paenibacillus harenae]
MRMRINTRHKQERLFRNRFINLLIILPLLLTALFAYQAGNNFELTAGSSRFNPVARATTCYARDGRSASKLLQPVRRKPAAYKASLAVLYGRPAYLSPLSQTILQQLKRLLLKPIKYTSVFIG